MVEYLILMITRILQSLNRFQDGVVMEAGSDNLTFTLTNFATVITDSSPLDESNRLTFSISFRSPEEAVCESYDITGAQLAVSSQPAADAIGSITFSECGSQRISYSVFRTDALFLTPETTTSDDYAVGSVIIGVRTVSGALPCDSETLSVNLQPLSEVCTCMVAM